MHTMTKSEAGQTHSPTPWKEIVGYSPELPTISNFTPYIVDANGNNVAAVLGITELSEAEFVERRRLIVRAVNAHAELVAALRKAQPWLGKFIADEHHLKC